MDSGNHDGYDGQEPSPRQSFTIDEFRSRAEQRERDGEPLVLSDITILPKKLIEDARPITESAKIADDFRSRWVETQRIQVEAQAELRRGSGRNGRSAGGASAPVGSWPGRRCSRRSPRACWVAERVDQVPRPRRGLASQGAADGPRFVL